MEYEVVAEAYRDLEQASGRLMLIDRLAALLARTPQELLPTVCYLCQGLVAPGIRRGRPGAGREDGSCAPSRQRPASSLSEVVAAVRESRRSRPGRRAVVGGDSWQIGSQACR